MVVGLPRREAACSGAARSRAPAKRPQQTISVLPRPSLGPPSKRAKILPKMIFRHNFAKHKIETFSDQCLVGIVSDSRDPVSCGTDLALAHLLLTLRQVASLSSCPKCSNETAPFSFPAAPHPQYVPEVDSPPSLLLDPPEFGLSALVRGVGLFRQLA